MVTGLRPQTIFTKPSILVIWEVSKYICYCNPVYIFFLNQTLAGVRDKDYKDLTILVFFFIYFSFCIFSAVLALVTFRSIHPEVFLGKGVLKICSKFRGEHPCRSSISMKLKSNFFEIKLRHGCSPVNLLYIFRTPSSKNTSGRLNNFFFSKSWLSFWWNITWFYLPNISRFSNFLVST